MEFELNQEREDYLRAKGFIVLDGSPGSGKTTVIAKKAVLIKQELEATKEFNSGLACISFTNVAKDELLEKIRTLNGNRPLGYPHLVSTIDSFINQYITLPFFYLLRPQKRPRILDNNELLDVMWNNFSYKTRDNRPLCKVYKPSTIQFTTAGSYTSDGKLPDDKKVDPQTFRNYGKALKSWQVENGLITTSDSAFLAFTLLRRHPRIGEFLIKRFKHILVDEAQDSSELQHLILETLCECGLKNLELIGDPYQAIYEWRDAKPEMFVNKREDSQVWKIFPLTENRRSNQRIVDCFSLIRKVSDPKLISKVNALDKGLPINIYRYNDSNRTTIVNHFTQLCNTNQLMACRVVVRGQSLRNSLLGINKVQYPWATPIAYDIIDAKLNMKNNSVKEAVKLIRKAFVNLKYPGVDYKTMKTNIELLAQDPQMNAYLFRVLHLIPEFSLTVSEWTNHCERLLKRVFKLPAVPDLKLRSRQSNLFDKNSLAQPMRTIFKSEIEVSSFSIPISTIHSVKGQSLDALLIFFDAKPHIQNLTFQDIHNQFSKFPSEIQRLIYVALSRPKHLLSLAFPEAISDKLIGEKFRNAIVVTDI